jgi:hypothetical protein
VSDFALTSEFAEAAKAIGGFMEGAQ